MKKLFVVGSILFLLSTLSYGETKPGLTLYEIPYLFQLPTTSMLKAYDMHFAGGGSYRVASNGNILANMGLGLGGVATLTLDTNEFLHNLTSKATPTQTASFKILLLHERKWVPGIVAEFITTSNVVQTKQKQIPITYTLNTVGPDALETPIEDEYEIYDSNNLVTQKVKITYLAKQASAQIIFGKTIFTDTNIYLGLRIDDVRIRNFFAYGAGLTNTEIQERIHLVNSFLFGCIRKVNNSTYSMFEVMGNPYYKFNTESVRLTIEPTYLIHAGVRFYLIRWLSLDAGIRYDTSSKGLADSTITTSLNMVIPSVEWGNKIVRVFSSQPETNTSKEQTDSVFCPNCNAGFKVTPKFCPRCGYKF
ncbi:MAG: zinc ribbon domain-containing protein [Elusimicrobiota bacterium]